MDAREKHLLSTKGMYVEPLWHREHKDRMAELKEKLDRELEFIDMLAEKGLLETHMKLENKFSKYGREKECLIQKLFNIL